MRLTVEVVARVERHMDQRPNGLWGSTIVFDITGPSTTWFPVVINAGEYVVPGPLPDGEKFCELFNDGKVDEARSHCDICVEQVVRARMSL